MTRTQPDPADGASDRRTLIVDAAVRILGTQGIAAMSMREVAREAGVALGLVNYHFQDKPGLVRAALLRLEDEDLAIVAPDERVEPRRHLERALHRVVEPRFLTTEYLSLRLQLWALAQADPEFADINATAQQRYRDGLARLIAAARPDLSAKECARRAADIDIIQNGIWLSALLRIDKPSLRRAVTQCETIAFT